MSIKSKIESILFVASKPIGYQALAKLVGATKNEIQDALYQLDSWYKSYQSGIRLVFGDQEVQMVSAPENSTIVKRFLKEEITGELTPPALETLTIIAYRGPMGKAELEQIRGINCSLILRNLLIRGLINMTENKKTRQKMYCVSVEFLKFLGIGSTRELPEYEKLSSHKAVEELLKTENYK